MVYTFKLIICNIHFYFKYQYTTIPLKMARWSEVAKVLEPPRLLEWEIDTTINVGYISQKDLINSYYMFILMKGWEKWT